MAITLPPLTALRAFDAAARHMSFAKAAEELHVTPAALSFQIKSLEEHLGAPLFVRLNRAVELTELGQVLAPGVQDGFQTLAVTWRTALRKLETHGLTVTAGPAFTAKWLAPRLFDFAQSHPEIELRFAATLRSMDLHRDAVDVAIRFGTGQRDDGLYVYPFDDEWVTPVMHPDLYDRYPTPDALRKAPLIVDESIDFLRPDPDWAAWFRVMGVDAPDHYSARFSQADHAIDAAAAGVGVALGRRSVVLKDIADGRLVAPFKVALSSGARFRFLCVDGAEKRQDIAAFLAWIIAEIDKLQSITDQLLIVPIDADPNQVAEQRRARGI